MVKETRRTPEDRTQAQTKRIGWIMTWDDFIADWADQMARVHALFPETDAVALTRFRGNFQHLVTYIADTQDLTHGEAADTIMERLLPGAQPALGDARRLAA